MLTPTGTAASDVKTGGVCQDSAGTAIAIKPTQTLTDSDSARLGASNQTQKVFYENKID